MERALEQSTPDSSWVKRWVVLYRSRVVVFDAPSDQGPSASRQSYETESISSIEYGSNSTADRFSFDAPLGTVAFKAPNHDGV
jgi:hypothetical protein